MQADVPNAGDKVVFQMPVKGVDTGTIVRIDGAYVSILINVGGNHITIERYINEVQKVN